MTNRFAIYARIAKNNSVALQKCINSLMYVAGLALLIRGFIAAFMVISGNLSGVTSVNVQKHDA